MRCFSCLLRICWFSIGTTFLTSGGFGKESPVPSAGARSVQPASLVRGDRIQPIAPKPALKNLVTAATNVPPLTIGSNAPAPFQEGRFFGFEKLAGYTIQIPEWLEYATNAPLADAEINAKIPAAIRAMEGRTILVNGYMTPLEFDGGKTPLFILSRSPSGCCFGDMPLIHEMIEVRMKGESVPVRSYLPVQVRGVLHVGAKRSGDVLACIYRLEGETVDEAER